MNSSITDSAINYIENLFKNNTDGHDANHSMRVYKTAMHIADSYPDCNKKIVSLSALLHDADDHKLFKTTNNENARCFLQSQKIDTAEIEQICSIINQVSFSKNRGKSPESIEGKIVQDADRLDAIGAVGIARTFAFGGKNGRSLEESLQHFYDKLLLLKDEMNTEEAGKIAAVRHAYLKGFIEEFRAEVNMDETSIPSSN